MNSGSGDLEVACQHEAARVLARLRELDERDLHKDIVWPLLERMGATCIRYVHGSFERGKDFLYLAPNFFGGEPELWVCQVKNERLTGRSSKLSESTVSFLFQALQCKKTAVLHPTRCIKQIPDRVGLLTTFALPDAPLADGEQLLSDIRSNCAIIGPEQLVALLSDNWQEKFVEFAYAGNEIGLATRQYLLAHREAIAFETRTTRSLDSFFVSIGLSAKHALFQRLLDNRLIVPASGSFTASAVEWEAISSRQSFLTSRYGLAPWITSQKSGANYTVSHEGVHKLHDSVISTVKKHAEQISADTGERVASSLLFVRLVTELLEIARPIFQLEQDTNASGKTDFSVFREILPGALAHADGDICITGTAGAGKTSLARILTLAANETGTNALYFPCSQIKSDHQCLDDAISQFLKSLSPTNDDVAIKKMISDASLIVLDGCDEATTFRSGLGEEIGDLLVPARAEIDVDRSLAKRLCVPKILDRIVRSARQRLEVLQWPSVFEWEYWIDANDEPDCKEFIRSFRQELLSKKKKVILTVRDESPLGLPNSVQVFAIRPFDDDQLLMFFQNWFRESETKVREISEFLDSHRYVKEICRTPINATIVAAAHERGLELPNSKFEIYHRRFELLLERWDRERDVSRNKEISGNDKMRFLGRIAYQVHIRKDQEFSASLAKSIWQEGFAHAYSSVKIEDVLDELEHVNCIIFGLSGSKYTFGHLSFQEYLAAVAIFHSQKVGKLVANYGNLWWRQVLIFYAGVCGDLDRFMNEMQASGGIREYGSLLQEMLSEARYTSPTIRNLVSDIRSSEYAIRSQSYGKNTEPHIDDEYWDRTEEDFEEDSAPHPDVGDSNDEAASLREKFESTFIDKGEYWEKTIRLGSAISQRVVQLIVYVDFPDVEDEQELPAKEHCEAAQDIESRLVEIVLDSIDHLLQSVAEAGRLPDLFDGEPNKDEVDVVSISITNTTSFTVSLEVGGRYFEVMWDGDGVLEIDDDY